MRIALGIMSHEANTFCPRAATRADFEANQVARGEALLSNWRAKRTEESGAMAVFAQTDGCEVIPTFGARALSSAPLTAEAFDSLLADLLAALREALPVDGVLLVLHGAMMADNAPDATGEILAQVRELVGPAVPIVGTLDLHANVTERMARMATALVGYHTAPHVDMFETGERAARLLVRTLQGEIAPTSALVRLPMILPPENSTHNYGPLSEVLARVNALAREGAILHGALYPTQPWMDTEGMASAVVVVTDNDPAAARAYAKELGGMFWERRGQFVLALIPPDEAVRRALARPSGVVIFCDSADATSSGSTGDSTAILQALLRAAPIAPLTLLNVVDAEVVAQAIAAGVGNEVSVQVGGKLAPQYFQPVPFTGRVKLISDGEFVFKGPGSKGVLHFMGRTVVLVQGGIHLVVMERPVSQWDPQLYRSLGLEPADARIVQVKSPMAFRAAYSAIFDEVLIIAAPGAASPEIKALPWKHVHRPIYPLDPETTWP